MRKPLGIRGTCLALVVLAGAMSTLSACSNNQRLAQYDFRNRTLGVATIAPPYPEVLSEMHLGVDTKNPVLSLLKAGAEVAREVSVRDFETRLDSAAKNVDVSGRMGDRVLKNGARQLRAVPVPDTSHPDYELEIRVRHYGITASSWASAAYFMIDADLRLLDGATGRRIWKARVRATEPVRSTSVDVDSRYDRSVGNVITAVTLARMSTDEIQRALETLADFAADHLVGKLADALD
ncbi:MAG: hypothetical protein P8099_10375 [Gemmatimonadota bacterium]